MNARSGMHVTIELRHLRGFVAVGQELHFTRAAEQLHLAQQALSAQISQLEAGLGTKLLHRTTRRVELTEAGQALLDRLVPVLASLSEALEQASSEAAQLTIAYTPTVAPEALPKILEALRERAPALQLRTLEMWQAESGFGVEAGRFDLGLARSPVLPDRLDSEVIRDEPLGAILSSGHQLSRRDRIAAGELSTETLAIWPREFSPNFYDLVVDSLGHRGFDGPVRELENMTRELFLDDTAARIEVAACRAFSVGFETEWNPLPSGFVWRAFDPALLIPLNMFWRRPATAAVRSFIDCARAVAQTEGWLAKPVSRATEVQNSTYSAAGSATEATAR